MSIPPDGDPVLVRRRAPRAVPAAVAPPLLTALVFGAFAESRASLGPTT